MWNINQTKTFLGIVALGIEKTEIETWSQVTNRLISKYSTEHNNAFLNKVFFKKTYIKQLCIDQVEKARGIWEPNRTFPLGNMIQYLLRQCSKGLYKISMPWLSRIQIEKSKEVKEKNLENTIKC